MEGFEICGGIPLTGTAQAGGSKNAALPIMAASILATQPVHLCRVPALADVATLALMLGHLGVEVVQRPDGEVSIDTRDLSPVRAPAALVRRMRASFCVLGPLLARRRKAIVALPGGCRIGDRPVNLHLAGLSRLGAEICVQRGHVVATARRLRGAKLDMAGPMGPTVTGTANVLCAAVLAEGTTIIDGAAREPEIVELGTFLSALGARIDGLGTSRLEVEGVDHLRGGAYRLISDRVEAATLMLAAAITGGEATVTGVDPRHFVAVLAVLTEIGCMVRATEDSITISAKSPLRATDLVASPYPGIATDLQAQLTTLLTLAAGRSHVVDDVFPGRFGHVAQLRRFGAKIRRSGEGATIEGVPQLSGADCSASDLRASAALVLAGLAARGRTLVRQIHHLDRGYERLEQKLSRLGASIRRVELPDNNRSRAKATLVQPPR